MPGDASHAPDMQASLTAILRKADWPLMALVAGFLFVAPIGIISGFSGSPFAWLCRLLAGDPFAAYDEALAAAALKRPDYQRKLKVIESTKETVNVVSFRFQQPLATEKRKDPMWVALPDELREACLGASEPARRLQHVLGLPPVSAGKYVVTELEVPRAGLFRPCIGKSDLAKESCEFALPDGPPDIPADAEVSREAFDKLRADYEALRFGAGHMWDTYRLNFKRPRPPESPSDYPYTGYPFTGMGWTYNWGSRSQDRYGVSEFIVKRDAAIKIVSEKSPGDFCAKPG